MSAAPAMFDVIVVGGGVEGSSTAYHLAKQGQKTLLLEQFPLPHSRGSSHGQSRITRKAYGSSDFYTTMMHESFRLMADLEQEVGEQLFVKCGMLAVGPPGEPFVKETFSGLRKQNIPVKQLGADDIKRKYPMLSYPENFIGVFEENAGALRADKVLKGFQSQFRRYGGVLHDGEPMTEIVPGDTVTVKTTRGQYRAKSVVVAVGAWAPKVLTNLGLNLPLKPIRITVCYWKDKTGCHGSDHLPTIIGKTGDGDFGIYGMPVIEYPGLVKLCLHTGPEIDPDFRDLPDDSWVLDRIRKYVRDHFPQLEPIPSVVESCIYTMTPDENFILDHHPSYRNIIVAAGFSGHGFKLSPVVGKVLAQMAVGREPAYNMAPFKINRFNKTAKL